MSDSGQSGPAPTNLNHLESGQCSFCAAPNPLTNIACNFCGSRLPWTFENATRGRFDLQLYLSRPQRQSLPPVTDDTIVKDTVLKDTVMKDTVPDELPLRELPLNGLSLSEASRTPFGSIDANITKH